MPIDNRSYAQRIEAIMDPQMYNPSTLGRGISNLYQNVKDLSGLGEESIDENYARQRMADRYIFEKDAIPSDSVDHYAREFAKNAANISDVAGPIKYIKDIPSELYHISPSKFTEFSSNPVNPGYNIQSYGKGTYTTPDIDAALGQHQTSIRSIRNIPEAVSMYIYETKHKPESSELKLFQQHQPLSEVLDEDPELVSELMALGGSVFSKDASIGNLSKSAENYLRSYYKASGLPLDVASAEAGKRIRQLLESRGYGASEIAKGSIAEYLTYDPKNLSITGSTEVLKQ